MSSEIPGKVLALVDIRGHTIYIVRDENSSTVYMYERWSSDEDLVEIELGNVDDDKIYEELANRIDEELKLPKPVKGRLKAKLKELKLPITMRLVESGQVTILDIKGSKGKAQLVIRYSLQ